MVLANPRQHAFYDSISGVKGQTCCASFRLISRKCMYPANTLPYTLSNFVPRSAQYSGLHNTLWRRYETLRKRYATRTVVCRKCASCLWLSIATVAACVGLVRTIFIRFIHGIFAEGADWGNVQLCALFAL